jgi:hypothetical protein
MSEHEPFVGSEALARGELSRHQLRTRYRALFPNVYLLRTETPSQRTLIAAAWLWSRRAATVAGLSAAVLHGSPWIENRLPVELVWSNARPPRGIVTHDLTLHDGEFQTLAGLLVTTPERTAFDIGRQRPVTLAVAHLDALARATGVKVCDVEELAAQHRGSRGLRRLETALNLVDPGAQSPKETWLRLILINAGLPRPTTQIPVLDDDGYAFAFLDMGWEEWMVAVEYDGDQHRVDRWQYVKDMRRIKRLEELGWIVIRVVAEDSPTSIVRRVCDAIDKRRSSLR